MRLYKTTYLCDGDKGVTTQQGVYDGTLAEASKQRVALKKDGMRNIETKEVDVPTDKAGLMAYLNELVSKNAQ